MCSCSADQNRRPRPSNQAVLAVLAWIVDLQPEHSGPVVHTCTHTPALARLSNILPLLALLACPWAGWAEAASNQPNSHQNCSHRTAEPLPLSAMTQAARVGSRARQGACPERPCGPHLHTCTHRHLLQLDARCRQHRACAPHTGGNGKCAKGAERVQCAQGTAGRLQMSHDQAALTPSVKCGGKDHRKCQAGASRSASHAYKPGERAGSRHQRQQVGAHDRGPNQTGVKM